MVHTRPCFTQTHDLHFPRLLQRQQTGPANLDRPSPIEVEVDWLRKRSDRRTGGRDGVGGNRLLVLLSTRGGEEDKRAPGEGTSEERPNASESAILLACSVYVCSNYSNEIFEQVEQGSM